MPRELVGQAVVGEERPPPSPEDLPRFKQVKRQQILDASERLLLTKDYDAIQVKDAADEAKVSLGTLYRYFSSKDHLLSCAISQWALGYDLSEASLRRTRTPKARVRQCYRRAANAFEGRPHLYATIMQVQVSRDPYARAQFALFAEHETIAFRRAVADFPEKYRAETISVLGAVLAQSLRGYALGLYPFEGVDERIDQAIAVIFRDPFPPIDR